MKRLILLIMLSFCYSSHLLGATYYVSKTGLDAHACSTTDSAGTNKLTITSGLTCLAAGDTLDIHSGTYTEAITSNGAIPNGSDDSHHTTVIGHAGETVTMNPGSGQAFHIGGARAYITIDHITVDFGSGNASNGIAIGRQSSGESSPPAHHIVIQNCTVKNGGQVGGAGGGNGGIASIGDATVGIGSNISVINNTVGPWGYNSLEHGIYAIWSTSTIEGNIVSSIFGYGIHLYSGNSTMNANTLRKNKITGSGQFGILAGGSGGGTATNTLIYDNISYGNTGGGIRLFNHGTSNGIYNNTVYNNGGYGVQIDGNQSGSLIKNNIIYLNTAGTILNNGSGTIQSNQLTSNPLFVNAGAADFHLLAGSLAIDFGLNLSSIFTDDYSGTARPLGLQWDIGAYEYGSPPNSITVFVPNGGESWQIGTTQSITWGSVGVGSTVEITLDRGNDGTFEQTISASTNNDGSFDWVVDGAANANCKIKVKDTAAATNDVSNSVFGIAASSIPSITITFPDATSHFFPGQTLPITWTSAGLSGNLAIYISRNNGSYYETTPIVSSIPFDQPDATWVVTGAACTQCKVKAVSLTDTSVVAISAAFKIAGTYLNIK